MMSDYLMKLSTEMKDVADRYRARISLINNVDPFCLTEDDIDCSINAFPAISMEDIAAYLVVTHSFYTAQQMLAFKSLEAWKFHEAGFVKLCGVTEINNFKIILAKVQHSQRLNEKPLSTWIMCDTNGSVHTAHCTCIAGASEVCSHVGATLYSVENIGRQQISCTDTLARWNVPHHKDARMISVRDMLNDKLKPNQALPPASDSDVMEMLEEIETAGGVCAVMAMVEPFKTRVFKQPTQTRCPTPTFASLYNDNNNCLMREELIVLGLAMPLHISEEDCSTIFECTKLQAETLEWYQHRKGRITASLFRSVCHTKLECPSLTLVNSICYPVPHSIRAKPVQWGRVNEKKALQKYVDTAKTTHQGFVFLQPGLIVATQYPEFGASPDGLVNCSCCGQGCVEVKCPYLLKSKSIDEYLLSRDCCLIKNGNEFKLKRDHAYYYQVQLQMIISKRDYCDFIVWSPTDFIVERVERNQEFWEAKYPVAKAFHSEVILPELLGKCFTK